MKDFILDVTYKDATIITSNDDALNVASSNLPSNSLTHHTKNLNTNNLSYNNSHKKSSKFDTYNIIDYL